MTPVDRTLRLMLYEHAAVMGLLAVAYSQTTDDPGWPAWGVAFAVAALFMVLFLLRPWSYALFRLAGTTTVLVLAARCVSPISRALEGSILGWRGVVGVVLYLHCAVGFSAWWLHAVGPYWQARRHP